MPLKHVLCFTTQEMQETISTYEQFYVHMYDKKGGKCLIIDSQLSRSQTLIFQIPS